jgi:MSHA biogenesis protein MshG
MAYFSYKGRNSAGELVQGVLEGADSGAIAAQLSGSGITPVDIGVTRKSSDNGVRNLLARFTKRRVDPTELLLFSRQMYALLKAGVPIMRALAGLQESATNPTFRDVLQDIRESLDNGRPLSTSMQRTGVFSPFYIAMVYVGETTGMLEEIFLRLYNHLEFQEFMHNQVKSALRYPIFVVAAMMIAIVIINLFVIPAFAKVYAGFHAQLPLLTRVLIGFSEFMVATWWLQALILIAAIFGCRSYISTESGRYKWDQMKMRIPVAGKIVLKATMARFARSFALAIRSGVPEPGRTDG